MNALQEPPSTNGPPRWWRLLWFVVIGALSLIGFSAAAAPAGALVASVASEALIDEVAASTQLTSLQVVGSRRHAARRVATRPWRLRRERPTAGWVPRVEARLVRWMHRAPPSWRGPPALLI